MAVVLEPFNPVIDRFDRRSVARMFQLFWPEASVARAVAQNIAASIHTAHTIADGCWELTLYPRGLRLNVGQVETMTMWHEGARFLFRAPLDVSPDERLEIVVDERPVYPAVPIPSGVCFIPSPQLAAMPAAIRVAHEAYIERAASLKRISPFKKSFSPAALEHIEWILGTSLPRPSYVVQEGVPRQVDPLPDELDASEPIVEGAWYQVVVNAYERDPLARQLCIAKHGTTCVICTFSFGATYGPVAEGFIHVHHLRPLSEIGGEYEVDPVEDLRPVCPNCHAVLHRRVPAFSITEVRGFIDERRASRNGRETASE